MGYTKILGLYFLLCIFSAEAMERVIDFSKELDQIETDFLALDELSQLQAVQLLCAKVDSDDERLQLGIALLYQALTISTATAQQPESWQPKKLPFYLIKDLKSHVHDMQDILNANGVPLENALQEKEKEPENLQEHDKEIVLDARLICVVL